MGKHTRKDRNKEKELEQEITDFEDLPENVFEILALLSTAALTMIKETNIGAFSGRHGDFIFSLVYDPSNRIDQKTYSSAMADIIKNIDPLLLLSIFLLHYQRMMKRKITKKNFSFEIKKTLSLLYDPQLKVKISVNIVTNNLPL
jgi:hypothetical protein